MSVGAHIQLPPREALTALAIPNTALQAVPAAGLCVGSRLLYPEKLAYLFGAVAYPAVQTLRLLRANALSAAASLTHIGVPGSRAPRSGLVVIGAGAGAGGRDAAPRGGPIAGAGPH